MTREAEDAELEGGDESVSRLIRSFGRALDRDVAESGGGVALVDRPDVPAPIAAVVVHDRVLTRRR